MDLSVKYSKTSKGGRAVLMKSRELSSIALSLLTRIDGKTQASAILQSLNISEDKFNQALAQLLNGAYIQVVQDFGPSVFDLKSAIEVEEISTEEFMNLGLPEEAPATKTPEQLEAEARAQAYAEEQARLANKAREQEEAERKLLMVTDILAKSGDKIDIEKLATDEPVLSEHERKAREKADARAKAETEALAKRAQARAERKAKDEVAPIPTNESLLPQDNSLDFTPAKAPIEAIKAGSAPVTPEPSKAQSDNEERTKESSRVAEIMAREKAEQQARTEAEERAKHQAAIDAKEEAIRKKREAAEQEARIKAEEKARKEAERLARKEEERARKIAEEKAKEEAKARARAEAEAKAREEAERRAKEKAEAEARAREESERRAKERAELQAKREQESREKAEAERKAREEARIRKEALALQKAEEKAEARKLAEEKALLKAEEKARKRAERAAAGPRWNIDTLAVARSSFIGIAVLLMILGGGLQFLSLNMLAQPIEQFAATNIGEPVKIKQIKASIWPKPHLILQDLTVGELMDIKARSVHVYPTVSSLMGEVKHVSLIEVEGMDISVDSTKRPIAWMVFNAKRQILMIDELSLKNLTIKEGAQELPAFDASINLLPDGGLETATISAKNIVATLTPAKGIYEVNIEASGWQMPYGPAFIFDELSAKGWADQNKLTITALEGKLYGGSAKANGLISWNSDWRAEGRFEISQLNLGLTSAVVSDTTSMQGSLFASGDFELSSSTPFGLFESPIVMSRFEVENGEISGLDLARAAAGREQVGGTTRFDQLSGGWTLRNHRYQLTQLSLKAGSLEAKGEIDIAPDQAVGGKIQTNLNLNSRQLQTRFNLSGKLGNIQVNR